MSTRNSNILTFWEKEYRGFSNLDFSLGPDTNNFGCT